MAVGSTPTPATIFAYTFYPLTADMTSVFTWPGPPLSKEEIMDGKLNFKKLLEEYLFKLHLVKHSPKFEDEKFREGYLDANLSWFQDMKAYCDDYVPKILPITEEIKFRYMLKDKLDGEAPAPLSGYFTYRDEIVPIYDDDYGQQDIMLFRGKEYSGGCYNFLAIHDFTYIVDQILEREYLEE